MTTQDRVWESIQLAFIAGMFVTAALRWNYVPDRLPVHWNAAGEVDGYGGRFTALALLPLIAAGVYLLLKYLPRVDPARANYARFAGAYLTVRVVVIVYLAFVYLVTNLAIGNEESIPVGDLLFGSIGILLIILGVAMRGFEPNWFAGIRTPWTLTSRLSWTKTHAAGGWVFIASGVAALGGALIGGVWAVAVMLATLLPGVLGLVVYSYLIWRGDPNRTSLTGH